MYSLDKAGGVRITDAGLFYGPVRLVAKNASGAYEPRPVKLLQKRLTPACLPDARRLQTVADALTRGDRAVADIAALHLRLPPFERAMLTRVHKANFDPDQPRDDDGKWTEEGGDSSTLSVDGNTEDSTAPRQGAVSILSTSGDQGDEPQVADSDPNLILVSTKEDPTQAKKRKFVKAHLADAQKAADQLGVPVENILGISALESGWGESRLAQSPINNFFGTYYPAPFSTNYVDALKPVKDKNGNLIYNKIAKFPDYTTSLNSFVSEVGPIIEGKKDPEDFARALQKSGKYGINPDDGSEEIDYIPNAASTIRLLRPIVNRLAPSL